MQIIKPERDTVYLNGIIHVVEYIYMVPIQYPDASCSISFTRRLLYFSHFYSFVCHRTQVDLIAIYNAKDHEMYRKVAQLRDPLNKEESGGRGYIKFSVVCLGPGDSQRAHDPANEEEEDEKVSTSAITSIISTTSLFSSNGFVSTNIFSRLHT